MILSIFYLTFELYIKTLFFALWSTMHWVQWYHSETFTVCLILEWNLFQLNSNTPWIVYRLHTSMDKMKNAHHPIFRLFVAYYNSTVCYNTWCLRTLSICINSFPIVRLQKRGRKKYIFDQHTNLRCSFVLFITWKTCDNSIITPTPCSVVECLKDAFVSTFSVCDYWARNTSYMYLMHSFCLYMIHFLPIVIEFES